MMLSKNIIDLFKNKLKDYLNYIIVFVCLLLAVSLVRSIFKIKKADKKILDAQQLVEELKVESEKLEEEVKIVQSDYFVEQQLRDKLGLAKEGEIVVVLPEDEVLRKLVPRRESEEEVLPNPNWRKWLNLFF